MDTFDKKTLVKVIFCAALMASIDGEVDRREWEVIHKFVKDRWRKEFGEFKAVQSQIIKDLKSLLATGTHLNEKLDQLVSLLSKHLHAAQKRVLIRLVEEVMLADGKMKSNEEALFNRFLKVLDQR